MFYSCPKCCGAGGSSSFDEFGRPEQMACYHCHGAGKINDLTMEDNRRETLVEILAAHMTYRQEEAAKENPTGEDWRFHAAESGVDLRTYRDHHYWLNRTRMINILKETNIDLVHCLLDLLAPPPEPIKVGCAVVEPVGNNDDAPF